MIEDHSSFNKNFSSSDKNSIEIALNEYDEVENLKKIWKNMIYVIFLKTYFYWEKRYKYGKIMSIIKFSNDKQILSVF